MYDKTSLLVQATWSDCKTTEDTKGDSNTNETKDVESEKERRSRIFSIWIMNANMFLIIIGYSIVAAGLYPYMKQV